MEAFFTHAAKEGALLYVYNGTRKIIEAVSPCRLTGSGDTFEEAFKDITRKFEEQHDINPASKEVAGQRDS